eukprot:539504_1
MQNDIMCATATCKEALLFSYKLRSTTNEANKQSEMINHIIESLKLEDCIDTKIGNDIIRGMSGGEKKRTSVGCELITNPSLIFLDECTSGLDSFTALNTLKILKKLTEKEKKCIIATLHQPSSDIFNMIDILLILCKGNVVYYGSSKNVLSYFSYLGYECPKYSNIAEYVVNCTQQNSEFFIEAWKKHINFSDYDQLSPSTKQASSFCNQLLLIMQREIQIFIRDPRPSKMRFIQTVLMALLVGILYWSLPYDHDGLRNRYGAIFFLTANQSMDVGIISSISIFPEQRLLFKKERNNNMYYTTSYFIAKSLITIPEQA